MVMAMVGMKMVMQVLMREEVIAMVAMMLAWMRLVLMKTLMSRQRCCWQC